MLENQIIKLQTTTLLHNAKSRYLAALLLYNYEKLSPLLILKLHFAYPYL
jgi:hypothetical protein